MKSVEEAAQEAITANRQLPIIAFFTGSAISYVGDVLTLLAIPWFVLQTTGSVTQTGITAFFSTLPAVCSSFFGGTLVDWLGYKRTSVISDFASGLSVMLVPLLYHTLGLAFWQLLLLVFLGGLLKAPGVTARAALVPDLAQLAHMRLERANALSDGFSRVSRLLGAPLAGILITLIGTSNLLWLDALSFAISALLIGWAVPPHISGVPVNKAQKGYLATIGEGIRFIWQDKLVAAIILTITVTNLLDGAYFSVVGPAYMKAIFHSPLPFGLLVAALGGAAFVGTLIYGTIGHHWPRRWTLGLCFTIGGALRFWMLLFFPILPVLIIWYMIAGLAIAPINPLLDTITQERVPIEMRARVFGALSAMGLAGVPLGTLASGYLVAWTSLSTTVFLIGLLYLLATLSLLVNPALKQM